MKKVYLISIEAGGGHRSTVNALQKLIAQQQLPWEIHVVEFFKEIVGTSNPQNTYNNLILKNKWLRFIYEPILSPLFKLEVQLRHAGWVALLKRYWREHQPDLVVSLQPYINQVLYESLQSVLPSVPFATLLIDLADCPPHFWIERQKQFLICPTERAVEQAKKLGHEENHIFQTSGVVIHPHFYEPINVNRRIERKRLGLDPDLPTGLVMFGGQGSKEMLEIAQRLDKSSLDLQLIFICGHNEKVARILRYQQSRLPRLVETFTTKIPYYMHLSDFLIGKPGPGCINEALVMKLPVITDCNAFTLMQERYNTEWITNNQVGIVIRNFRNIDQAVAKLIQPENLAYYQANASAINNQGVFEVVDILARLLRSDEMLSFNQLEFMRSPSRNQIIVQKF